MDFDDAGLRIECRVKNASLYNAIKRNCQEDAVLMKTSPIRVCSFFTDIPYSSLLQYINLRKSPYYTDGTLKEQAVHLSAFLEVSPHYIYPPELYQNHIPSVIVKEIPLSRIAAATPQLLLESPVQKEILVKEVKALVCDRLSRIRQDKARVLNLRFGLDDDCERTLEQIGGKDKSRERIRQLESGGLRDMRSYSKLFKAYKNLD